MMHERTHDTADEIRYLNSVGRNPTLFEMHKTSRKELLLRYIESAAMRHDWGQIDKHAALAHAHKILANEFATVPPNPKRGRPYKKEEAV